MRANHANVKTRLTIMLQLTSLGGVLPSYEFQSRLDTVDYSYMFLLLNLNMALVVFFCVNECLEAYLDGFFTYFTNMWNLMDWVRHWLQPQPPKCPMPNAQCLMPHCPIAPLPQCRNAPMSKLIGAMPQRLNVPMSKCPVPQCRIAHP